MEKAASGIAVEETPEEKAIREAKEQMIQEEKDIEMRLPSCERSDQHHKRPIQ